MKARPILFSAPMVRAILDGRKTVTRRVMNPQPEDVDSFQGLGSGLLRSWPSGKYRFCTHEGLSKWAQDLSSPYGGAGCRLWVKETHHAEHYSASDDYPKIVYRADMAEHDHDGRSVCPSASRTSDYAGKWTPSIFMPRWASRILLDVVSVRVERLQEITDEEAQAEGLWGPMIDHELDKMVNQIGVMPCAAFRQLWDGINKDRGYGWDVNPWVWRVEFRRVES